MWEEQSTNLKSSHISVGRFPEEKNKDLVITLTVATVLPSHAAHTAPLVSAEIAESQGKSHRGGGGRHRERDTD